jgi:hypothetical protein
MNMDPSINVHGRGGDKRVKRQHVERYCGSKPTLSSTCVACSGVVTRQKNKLSDYNFITRLVTRGVTSRGMTQHSIWWEGPGLSLAGVTTTFDPGKVGSTRCTTGARMMEHSEGRRLTPRVSFLVI